MVNVEINKVVLPYGASDIKPTNEIDYCCPIKGCNVQIIEYPSRKKPRDGNSNYCQKHKIYCRRNTYIYKEKVDNLIVDTDLFKDIFEKPVNKKYDIEKIGHEKSEDALTWNVFVTLKKAGKLKTITSLISSEACEEEPELILWGYDLKERLLVQELESFRTRFECKLQILTEPDIVLKTAKEMFLIEAKLCSPNSRKEISVWKDKEINKKTKRAYEPYRIRYKNLIDEVLNKDIIEEQKKFCSQLVRYVLYANYAYKNKSYYIVNLLPKNFRLNKEINSIEKEFKPYLKKDIFKTITWEDIYKSVENLKGESIIVLLRKYLQEKTANFKKAFTI